MAVQYAFSQITTQGLKLAVDAADPLSYPGSGTTWTDVTGNGFTGTVSSSISFVTTNRGALYSANSSSAVTFSGSAVNFGSDSFTVEMAFSPQVINGQHFLFSKNSGSFPNFGAFLTGSGGSGRLVAFYNVSSTISCSASTPTGSFITGSNYIVDVTYVPTFLAAYIYTNSNFVTQSTANGVGSLSTSASLFLLNNSTSSNAGSVVNLYSYKVYNPYIGSSPIRKNYNAQAARFSLPLATYIPPAPLLLDNYSGATVAYSLRKLRTSYSGAAIQVRRSSDNATADIGFDVNGNLDTATLLSFCGVGNGFITTWYDQSGNVNNVVQATALNQPQIVSSGNVLLDNGKPTLQFDGSNDVLLSTLAIDPLFITSVNKPNTTGTYKTIFGADTSDAVNVGSIYFQYISPARIPGFARTTTLDSTTASDFFATGSIAVSNNVVNLMTGIRNNTNIQVYINNAQVGSDTTASTLRPVGGINSGRFTLMAGYYSDNITDYLTGTLSEFIAYTIDQSSNRTAINSDINSYYSIY